MFRPTVQKFLTTAILVSWVHYCRANSFTFQKDLSLAGFLSALIWNWEVNFEANFSFSSDMVLYTPAVCLFHDIVSNSQSLVKISSQFGLGCQATGLNLS